MDRNQLKAIAIVASCALLAFPAYVILGVITIPIGIGIVMLMKPDPWPYLYPFIFAGTPGTTSLYGGSSGPVYYLASAVSIPLSIVQWVLIGWASSFYLRRFPTRGMVKRALVIIAAVGVVTAVLLSALGVRVLITAAHM
jgi:hypothetical protein